MKKVNKVTLEVTDQGAVYVNNTRITGRNTKWGVHRTMFSIVINPKDIIATLNEYGYGHIKVDSDYHKEILEQLGHA